MRQIAASLDENSIKKFDKIRGMVSRSTYIRKLILDEIAAVDIQEEENDL